VDRQTRRHGRLPGSGLPPLNRPLLITHLRVEQPWPWHRAFNEAASLPECGCARPTAQGLQPRHSRGCHDPLTESPRSTRKITASADMPMPTDSNEMQRPADDQAEVPTAPPRRPRNLIVEYPPCQRCQSELLELASLALKGCPEAISVCISIQNYWCAGFPAVA